MLRVIIEIVPGGHRELRRTIASMAIGNLSNLANVSDYEVDALPRQRFREAEFDEL